MPNLTSGDLKNESLHSKKSLGTEGRPEKPSKKKKMLKAPACYEKPRVHEAPSPPFTAALLTDTEVSSRGD